MKKITASAAILLSILVISCSKENDAIAERQNEQQLQMDNKEQSKKTLDAISKSGTRLSPAVENTVSTITPGDIKVNPNLKVSAPRSSSSEVQFTVTNSGGSKAGAFTISMKTLRGQEYFILVPVLYVGETKSFRTKPGVVADWTITADCFNYVKELSETDNIVNTRSYEIR